MKMNEENFLKELYRTLIIGYLVGTWVTNMIVMLYTSPINVFIANIISLVIVHIIWFISCVVLD